MESGFSDVSVCNSGLLKIGAMQISSLADGTRSANFCQTMYPILRDEVMRAAPWRFALSQVPLLLPSGTPPAFGYNTAYDVPSNVLRVWKVNVDNWTEIGNQVMCDKADGINCLCVVQNTDPTSWDVQFAEALSWRIAMEGSLNLVQSAAFKQEMEKSYKDCLNLARSTNAVIGTSESLIADQWSSARKYGYDRFWPINAGPPEPYGD